MRKLWQILCYLYDRFFDDGCSYRAASLAYSTLLALVPLILISAFILSQFPILKGVGETLQKFILENFVATSANVISQHLNYFLASIVRLRWTSLISLTVVSLLLMYNMVRAFNAIWNVQMRRHFAISFLFYLVILLLSPIFFGLLLLISSYLATLPLLSGSHVTLFIKRPLLLLLPYICAFIAFTFFNWVLPNTRVPFKYAIVAGFFTTVLFEMAKYIFSLYLSYFPTYRIIYGALATIPIFLIWLYVSWTIILLGAVLCRGLTVKFKANSSGISSPLNS